MWDYPYCLRVETLRTTQEGVHPKLGPFGFRMEKVSGPLPEHLAGGLKAEVTPHSYTHFRDSTCSPPLAPIARGLSWSLTFPGNGPWFGEGLPAPSSVRRRRKH